MFKLAYVRDAIDKQIATGIAGYLNLGIEALRFDGSNKLVIGKNNDHDIAGMLYDSSQLPLIVFDMHTDMYSGSRPPSEENCGNWVYFQLKAGREVHLVMPSPQNTFELSWLPVDSKLFVYTPKGVCLAEFNLDGHSIVTKSVLPMRELRSLKGTKKQISIDEDFFNRNWRSERLEEILSKIINRGDQIDFWIERRYSTSPRHIASGLRNAVGILQES